MENVRQFSHARGGGLHETYNVSVLFHKLQGLDDAIIEDVVFLLAVACCLVLLVHHLRRHAIVNILF
jgi:hypothetical protein